MNKKARPCSRTYPPPAAPKASVHLTAHAVLADHRHRRILAADAKLLRLYSGTCTSGNAAEMDAIAAVVIGGTSMSGGSGKLGGTLIGALIIGILNNGLNLMGVNSDWQYIIKGIVILGAVYVDYLRTQKKAK